MVKESLPGVRLNRTPGHSPAWPARRGFDGEPKSRERPEFLAGRVDPVIRPNERIASTEAADFTHRIAPKAAVYDPPSSVDRIALPFVESRSRR